MLQYRLILKFKKRRDTMKKLFELVQEYLVREEESDSNWGEEMASIYANELSDNEEQWGTVENKEGELIAKRLK